MALSKILVIEDETSNSRLVEVTLRQVGQTIVRANGLAGLDYARGGDVALVILDIALPGMGGWEVLAALRDDPSTMHIPVIVLTAHAGNEAMMRAYAAGADGFMEKPFYPEELRRAVRELLNPRTGVEAPGIS